MTRGLVGISKSTSKSPKIILLLDKVLHKSNKNENSLKKHESVSLLFLLDGDLYRQKS